MDTRQLAVDLMAAVTAGDWSTLEAICAEDVQAEFLDVMALAGRVAFLRVLRNEHRQFAGFHAEVVEVLMRDETSVCFRIRQGGTQNGRIITPRCEYPPTGRSYEVEELCWLRTTGGLITRAVFGLNLLSLWTQLGHISPP
jgi:hypothetical protein